MEHYSSFESQPPRENEKIFRPSIRLEFFRHDKKETKKEEQPNETVRLTKEGRVHATKAGNSQDPHSEVAIIYASPRQRSQETAYRHMFATEPNITNEMSLEDIQAMIDAELVAQGGLNKGQLKKEIITDHLNFQWDTSTPLGAEVEEHYIQKKDALLFVWQSSDRRAHELHDLTSTTYSRAAGNIAELVLKYVKILPRWEQIVKNHPEKYKEFKNELQRFFGSHQSVTECFLMKVIEKTQGKEAVLKFFAHLPNKNGFDFSEGFTFSIESMQDGQPNLLIRFHDQTWNIQVSMIDEMIRERDELNQSIMEQKEDF